MDKYAELSKKERQLHEEVVEAIKEVLTEKGYEPSNEIIPLTNFKVRWLSDRVLVKGYNIRYESHTDHLSISELLDVLRESYHIIPKI